jgi:Transposase DDE domain
VHPSPNDPLARAGSTARPRDAFVAQAAVDTDSMLIVSAELSQRPTDRRLLKPMLRRLAELPVGKPEAIIADAGYFSEVNVEPCAESGFTPYIVPKRDRHHWGMRHWKPRRLRGRELRILQNAVSAADARRA